MADMHTPTPAKKTLKFQMMMSQVEAAQLDDWAFSNRIKSRAEAIRQLCAKALSAPSRDAETVKALREALTASRQCVLGYIDRCDYTNGHNVLSQIDAALAGIAS